VTAISTRLEAEFGRGFGEKNLRRMIQFAEKFPDEQIVSALLRQLGWTHFTLLLPIKDSLRREFYAEMCRIERWNTRTLQKKIQSMLFERTALSRRPKQLAEVELKALRRLVAVELKIGDFQPGDKGQMELYLRWLDRHERKNDEAAPIGLILCAGKRQETIELLDLDTSGIRVSSYWTEALPKAALESKLHEAMRLARERMMQKQLGKEASQNRSLRVGKAAQRSQRGFQ